MLQAQDEYSYGGSPEITAATTQIVSGVTDDKARAQTIYRYLAENISFHTHSPQAENETPEDQSAGAVLKRKSADSRGYANLFHAMAGAAGLDCELVLGRARPFSNAPRMDIEPVEHAWNAVKLGEEYFLFDSCWGAGSLDSSGKFVAEPTDEWSMVPARAFLYSHYPTQAEQQYLAEPLDQQQLLNQPQLKPKFFQCGFQMEEPARGHFRFDHRQELNFSGGEESYLKGAVYDREGRKVSGSVMVEKGEQLTRLILQLSKPGDYELRLRARKTEEERSLYAGSLYLTALKGVPDKPRATATPGLDPDPVPNTTSPEANSHLTAPTTVKPDKTPDSVSRRAALVTAGATTDREKAYALYRYLAENISYDAYSFLHKKNTDYPDQSAQAVLQRKTAVCAGYSELYQAMARSVGLECEIVSGQANTDPLAQEQRNTGHAWNAVKIDGRWHLLDSTWGAGHIDNSLQAFTKNTNDDWFSVPPEQFVYTHLPDDEEWQLLEKPITKKEFEGLPNLRPQFFQSGFKLKNPKQGSYQGGDSLAIDFERTQQARLYASLEDLSEKRRQGYTFVQDSGDSCQVRVRFPQPGKYYLALFSRVKESDEGTYLGKLYLNASSSNSTPFPKLYGAFRKNGCRLLDGFDGSLREGSPTTIVIKVPKAATVTLRSGEEKTPFTKTGDSSFTANFTPKGDKVLVTANFGDDRNHFLLEYGVR